jgi:hypothetical protein
MKVRTQYGITGLSGKADGMVYYFLPNCDVTIARRLPKEFNEAAQHNDYRLIARNLKEIHPSDAYKNDFRVYTTLYKDLDGADPKISSWYNLYIRMLWAMQEEGLVDLKTVTREQIYTEDLPCRSVKAAAEAGFLPAVLNYQNLDKGI